MNRILTISLVLIMTTILFMTACAEPPPRSAVPKRAQGQAFIMVIERVQGLAQTYEAKEYVALLFPPLSSESEYDEELKAWTITITAFPTEARNGFKSAEWFDGDVDEHFSAFKEATWVVYDYGQIVPMGGAFMIEADIEKLNIDKALPASPPKPRPAPTPPQPPTPPVPVPVPVPKPPPGTIELKLSTTFSPQSLQAQVAQRFAERIAEETNGMLVISVHPGSSLHPAPDLIDGVKEGIADMGFGMVYGLKDYEISVALPFILTAPDSYTAIEVYNGLWQEFPDEMAKEWNDVKIVFAGCTVPQYFCFRDKEVKSMADLNGLKMSVHSQEMATLVSQLGGVPVRMPLTDLAIGLENGVVDGYIGQLTTVRTYKLSMLKYCLQIRDSSFGVPTPNFMIMNKDTWNSLPTELRKVIKDSEEWGQQMICDLWTEAEHDAIDYMEDYGCELYYLSRDEEDEWLVTRDQVAGEIAQNLDAKGIPGTEILQFIRKELK